MLTTLKGHAHFHLIKTSRWISLLGRKKSPLDPSCCPVCGITLRSSDLESHFVQEIERLERVSRSYRSAATHSSVSPSSSSMSAPSTTQVQKREQDTRWEVLLRWEPAVLDWFQDFSRFCRLFTVFKLIVPTEWELRLVSVVLTSGKTCTWTLQLLDAHPTPRAPSVGRRCMEQLKNWTCMLSSACAG